MNTSCSDQVDALKSIIAESETAQHEVIGQLDELAKVWPLPSDAVGNIVAQVEAMLCRHSARLTRIAIRAQRGLPPFDHDGFESDLAEEGYRRELNPLGDH